MTFWDLVNLGLFSFKNRIQGCSEIALKLLWSCSEVALKLIWNCSENWRSFRLLRFFSGILTTFLGGKFSTDWFWLPKMALWNRSEVALKSPWVWFILRYFQVDEEQSLWSCSEGWSYFWFVKFIRLLQVDVRLWWAVALKPLWNCSETARGVDYSSGSLNLDGNGSGIALRMDYGRSPVRNGSEIGWKKLWNDRAFQLTRNRSFDHEADTTANNQIWALGCYFLKSGSWSGTRNQIMSTCFLIAAKNAFMLCC